ncbi:MAG: WG repeat-containing protein [Clostridiales bacterium]|nr:WG repeat-containing protein [Clostridiales bacterium]
MKRMLLILLALAICLTATAFAETTVSTVTVKGASYNSVSNSLTNTIAIQMPDGWYLFSADGTKVTGTAYDNVKRVYDAPYYTVSNKGLDGVIDADGKVIVPTEYDDVEVVSYRWAYGVVLTPSGNDQGDYYSTDNSGKKVYFNVDHYDFYYRGEKVGTLPRSGFAQNNYAYGRGDYLQLRDRDGAYHHYSKEFVDSGINESGEYVYSNRKYIHTGTGQTVWSADCTLTADEVADAYDDDHGFVIDLQGNKLFAYNYSYIGTFNNGIAYFKTNQGGFGLVDLQGNELLPGIYDSIDYSFYDAIDTGYVAVSKDGLSGLASLKGMDTSNTFRYSKEVVSEKTPFLYAKGMDGKYIVITATAGELEQHFEDVSFLGNGCPLFVGKTADGKVAVYGMNGEVILSRDNWRYTSSISISRDGSFAYEGNRGDNGYEYTLYTINYEIPEGVAAALPEGHWICSACGQERSTAFCPEDGTPKPVTASSTWVCPSCGKEVESAFCPNDGTKKPE